MTIDTDLLRQINNAIIDLQSSHQQTFFQPLKTLARLLRHPNLDSVNQKLTAGLDFEAFLAKSETTGGGMAGSHKLAWPEDHEQCLGMKLLLIEKLASDEHYVLNFSFQYFYSGSKIIAGIHTLTGQELVPFARDYKAYVMSQTETRLRPVNTDSKKVFIVHGHDDAALQGLARFIEKLGLAPIVLREQPNQGRTIIEKYEECASEVGYAIVLLTPDDIVSIGAVKGPPIGV
jgi:hypothetical protein